jgi:hypothetical protein
MKKLLLILVAFMLAFSTMGCSDAEIASQNMSRAADQFEIYRRVVFYNGITDQYILMVEGYCSITVDRADNQLELMVKTGNGTYIKHYLGLSDNVTYFVEQLEPSQVSKDHYRVIFKPSAIVPNVEVR